MSDGYHPASSACSGLVIEGVSSSGKSTLLRSLLADERYLARGFASAIVLSEHHTQRVLEPIESGRGLTVTDNVRLLEEITRWLRQRSARALGHDWESRGRIAHRLAFVLERFHITHAFHYDHVSWTDVAHVDGELATLGTRLVVLTIGEAAIRARLESRGDAWQRYARTLGSTDTELVAHFLDQQSRLVELAERSRLPRLVLDATRLSPDAVREEVIRFWLPGPGTDA